MPPLPGGCHGCATGLRRRSSFHIGRLRARRSRRSGRRLLARRLCGLGLRGIRQRIALPLAFRVGLARLGVRP